MDVASCLGKNGVSYGPELSSLLTDGTGDGGSLHLTLSVDDLFMISKSVPLQPNLGQWIECRFKGAGAPIQPNKQNRNPPYSQQPIQRPQGITHNTSVVLEVEVDTVRPSPGLALTDDNSRHDLLTELRLSLLDGGHDHVTDTRGGETVQARTNALNRDDVEVTGTGVVAAVEDGSTIRRMSLASLFLQFFQFVYCDSCVCDGRC